MTDPTDPTLFLSLAGLICFVGALLLLRPVMSRGQAWFFAMALTGVAAAAAIGSIVLGWGIR